MDRSAAAERADVGLEGTVVFLLGSFLDPSEVDLVSGGLRPLLGFLVREVFFSILFSFWAAIGRLMSGASPTTGASVLRDPRAEATAFTLALMLLACFISEKTIQTRKVR